jgi:hypothetical protein
MFSGLDGDVATSLLLSQLLARPTSRMTNPIGFRMTNEMGASRYMYDEYSGWLCPYMAFKMGYLKNKLSCWTNDRASISPSKHNFKTCQGEDQLGIGER